MTELELIQGLRNGDENAFRFLVDTYQDRIFNTSLGIVQNAEDAEDVAQEVFIQVYKSIHSFKGESKLSTWMYRIATTRSLDLFAKQKEQKDQVWFSGCLEMEMSRYMKFLTLITPV